MSLLIFHHSADADRDVYSAGKHQLPQRWAVLPKNINRITHLKQNTIAPAAAAVWAIVACVLWSTAFVAIKVGLAHSKPFSFAGIRFMLSGLILVPFWLGKVHRRDISIHSFKVIITVAVLQTFLLYGFFYFAMTLVSGAVASIIVGASPIVSAVVAHFACRDDKLHKTKVICMGLAGFGIVFVVLGTQPWRVGGIMDVAGICLLVCGSVVSTFGNIVVSKEKKNLHPVFLTSVQIFCGGLMLFFLSLPLEGQPEVTGLPVRFYFLLGWLSFLSAAAFSIWFYLLQHENIKVSELNMWKFLIPVFGATLSWIFLAEESPDLLTLCGMALVASAVWKFNR